MNKQPASFSIAMKNGSNTAPRPRRSSLDSQESGLSASSSSVFSEISWDDEIVAKHLGMSEAALQDHLEYNKKDDTSSLSSAATATTEGVDSFGADAESATEKDGVTDTGTGGGSHTGITPCASRKMRPRASIRGSITSYSGTVLESIQECDVSSDEETTHHQKTSITFAKFEPQPDDASISYGSEGSLHVDDIFVRPEAIEDDGITSNIERRVVPRGIQTFIKTQLTYARQARDSTLMSTRDENGQLPLHMALQHDPETLGSIKLLVKGNRDAVRIPDNDGSLPLHVAVQCHNGSHYATKVVDYLIGLDSDTLTAVDGEGNSALHHACRGSKYETIGLLLKEHDAVAVSKRNAHNKLPIHLLVFESNAGTDTEEDTKYVESIYGLLRAYPETVMEEKEESNPEDCLSYSGKKRKFGMK